MLIHVQLQEPTATVYIRFLQVVSQQRTSYIRVFNKFTKRQVPANSSRHFWSTLCAYSPICPVLCRCVVQTEAGVLSRLHGANHRHNVQHAPASSSTVLRHLHDSADHGHLIHESVRLPAAVRLR